MLLIKRGLIIFHNSLIIKAQYCRRENISICSKTYLSVTVAYSIAQVTHLRQTGTELLNTWLLINSRSA